MSHGGQSVVTRDGRRMKLCVSKSPRVMEVHSILPPYEVVGWLCLECGESVNPYEDKVRVVIVPESDSLEADGSEIWFDSSVGEWVTVGPREQRPDWKHGMPEDTTSLREPVFWEPLDDAVRNYA